ncbi:MAG: hypothetical protein M1412_05105 [Deltaproteobacteria bacterium]|nr:hypothetical protein [Deltaproteobacteria bacterium]MCL5892526.1 hypothetical protein [Deltaproteobacteria bacterium]
MAENANEVQRSSKIDVGAALTNKLTEKPQALEHLLNIIGRLDTLDEFSAILQAQKESATDAMVQRVADNITTSLSMLDSFSGEEQLSMIKKFGEKSESLKKGIEKIDELERSGTLQILKEMGDFVAGFAKGTTDAMIERMAGTAEKLAELTDALSDENMSGLVKKTQQISKSLESSLEKIDELERSGTLQILKEMGDFAAGFAKGTTDAMIERMAGTAEKLAELTDLTLQYNIKPLLDAGQGFIDSNTLNDLVELANGVASARRMMTDGLIDRAVGTGLDMVEAILTQLDVKELVKAFDCSMHETLTEADDEKYHKGGIFSLISLTKDKDVIFGLKFMMLLAKNLTKNLRENQQSIFISSSFGKED